MLTLQIFVYWQIEERTARYDHHRAIERRFEQCRVLIVVKNMIRRGVLIRITGWGRHGRSLQPLWSITIGYVGAAIGTGQIYQYALLAGESHMNNITELSREFCRQNNLPWDEVVDSDGYCSCGQYHSSPLAYLMGAKCPRTADFTDARNVLDVCRGWKDYRLFMATLQYGPDQGVEAIDWDGSIDVDLITDRTGKLLRMAVEWKDNKEK
jgi:hypothetical protein